MSFLEFYSLHSFNESSRLGLGLDEPSLDFYIRCILISLLDLVELDLDEFLRFLLIAFFQRVFRVGFGFR